MVITEPQIRRIMPNAKSANVKPFVEAFNKYSDDFGITTKIRACHLLAQLAHESGELSHTEENLNYSTEGLRKVFSKYFPTDAIAAAYARKPQQIANKVYANRMGNGNEQSGDGWKYKGRGLIQLTGKDNYANYMNSGYCVGNILEHPEWVAQYPGAIKSAMWYWKANGCNALADKDDAIAITKRINGGTNGLAQRLYFLRKAKKVLCV